MKEKQTKSFVEEIGAHLHEHAHAHVFLTTDEETTSLACSGDPDTGAVERLLLLAKITSHCASLDDGASGVILRVLVAHDPEEDKPALCQVRGYMLTPEAWKKIPKEEMPGMYNVDAETGEPVEQPPGIIFA